jgi:hypothetical protein
LIGKPEGRRPLERMEVIIKMDIREVVWGSWTESIWLRTGTGGELF